jgi:hypothetical protein
VVGELAVGLPVGRDQLERVESLQDWPDHRTGHAVATVEHHAQRADRRGIDERERARLELGVDVHLLDAAGRDVGRGQAVDDERAHVADPGVARQRQRALAHELGARVGLRVVRGRAHQAAVELARPDEEVEHLGADHPGVQHVRALRHHPVAIPRGELWCCEPHVPPEADPQAGRRLAAQAGEHARERPADLLGDVAVELLAAQAADVVGLEDLVGNGGRHGERG